MNKRLNRIISLILSVCLVFTAGGIIASSESSEEHNYYVINGGIGDGKTVETPAASVYDVIKTINADGLTAGDTATVFIMQKNVTKFKNSGTGNSELTYWSNIDATENSFKPEVHHDAKIIVEAYDKKRTTYLATDSGIATGKALFLCGPTEFKDVTIVSTKYNDSFIATLGNDLKVGSETKYSTIWADSASNWDGVVWSNPNIDAGMNIRAGTRWHDTTIEGNAKITIGNIYDTDKKWTDLLLANNIGTYVYKKDLNVTANNSQKLKITLGNSGQGPTTVNKNFNINADNAAALTLTAGAGNFTVNGAFQVILNKKTLYSGDASTFTNVKIDGDIYELTNTTDYSDLVSFTETAGTYKVKTGYQVTATEASGKAYVSSGSILSLEKGQYTLTAEKGTVYSKYYVKRGGTGDGRTEESPAASVYDAIKTINADGLTTGDTANVCIMQNDDWNTNSGKAHNMTYWADEKNINSNSFSPVMHKAKIVVQAYDPTKTTYLASDPYIATGMPFFLCGPTEFKNITLVSTQYTSSTIDAFGNSYKFGRGTKFGGLQYNSFGENDTWSGKVGEFSALKVRFGGNWSDKTLTDDVNVVFENDFITQEDWGSNIILANSIGTYTFKKDFNFTVDNSNAYVVLNLGNSNQGATNIEGNLNIVADSAYVLKLMSDNNEKSPVEVGGAIQVITNYGAEYSGDISSFTNVTAEGGVWVLNVKEKINKAISLTDTAGTFKVTDGYIAIATDADGNKKLSENGVITLSQGTYEIDIADHYTNDGETITVYDETSIDFTNEKHTDKENKVFVGWKKSDGQYAANGETFAKGEVITAIYVDVSADNYKVEEAQIRTDGAPALRFVVKQDKATVSQIPNIIEQGIISLPTDTALGRHIFLDTPIVLEWQWDTDDKNNFSPKTTGETPQKIVAKNILEESETEKRYTACLTDISKDNYNTFYLARGYIKYTDYNGIENVVYTETAQNSLYKLAAEAKANGTVNKTYDSIVDYVENVWTPNYLNSISQNIQYLSGYNTTADKNPNHRIYRLANGTYIRDVTVNSGMNVEKTEICFITDAHFNYINEYDISFNNFQALASYRGRLAFRDGSPISRMTEMMKYAGTFKKTLIGGDIADYMSLGALNAVKSLITDKSVNNSVSMAYGNHETAENMQPDVIVETKYTMAERFDIVRKYWTNDGYFYSEVMKDSSGNPNTMLIVLDNSGEHYWASQIEPLKAAIAYAREKKIPVLLFEHVPINTCNPNDEKVYIKSGWIGGDYFASENTEVDVIFDYSTYPKWLGSEEEKTTSDEIYRIIRQSSDVIKGIFCGHEHANAYTELIALDNDGNVLKDADGNTVVIPQHTGYAAYGGGFMKITIQ